MKVTINEKQTEGEVKYPCLMECVEIKDKEFVVLMIGYECGVVIDSGKSDYNMGHHSGRWDMSTFAPFKGSITLEND